MKNNNRPEDKDKDKGGGSGSTNHGNTGCPHQWIVSNTPPTATTHEVTCNKCNLTRNENHDFTYSCVSDSIHQAYCKICKCTVNQEHAFDIMFDENGELIRKKGTNISVQVLVCAEKKELGKPKTMKKLVLMLRQTPATPLESGSTRIRKL